MTLNKLSDSMKVDMPAWLNDEIFEVMLGGAAKPSVLVPASSSDSGSSGQLKVVSGTLTLSEKSLATPVEIAAGMCLGTVETETEVAPFSLFTPVACQ